MALFASPQVKPDVRASLRAKFSSSWARLSMLRFDISYPPLKGQDGAPLAPADFRSVVAMRGNASNDEHCGLLKSAAHCRRSYGTKCSTIWKRRLGNYADFCVEVK